MKLNATTITDHEIRIILAKAWASGKTFEAMIALAALSTVREGEIGYAVRQHARDVCCGFILFAGQS